MSDAAHSNSINRKVTRIAQGEAAQDGAGVKLTRILGSRNVSMHDPFLMLDHFSSDDAADYLAGFPDHPHRGFETVTYMHAGRMRHKDNRGHEGVIEKGGVQWMTAGKGIVHSEMPEQEEGLMSGFQLWINLPSAEKMKTPGYQEFDAQDIPIDGRDGIVIKVIAGQTSNNVTGPISGISTNPIYFDIALDDGNELIEPIPDGHSAFLYVYDGTINCGGETLSKGDIGLLNEVGSLKTRAQSGNAKFILLAGKPIGEPVAWGGPFVMNTKAEVLQAFQDYQNGQF